MWMTHCPGLKSAENREAGLADGCPIALQPEREAWGWGDKYTRSGGSQSWSPVCVPQGNKMVTIEIVSPAGPAGQEDSQPTKLDILRLPRAAVNTAR